MRDPRHNRWVGKQFLVPMTIKRYVEGLFPAWTYTAAGAGSDAAVGVSDNGPRDVKVKTSSRSRKNRLAQTAYTTVYTFMYNIYLCIICVCVRIICKNRYTMIEK